MQFGLKKEIIQQINSAFQKIPEIEKVIIYGSRAKGTYKNNSDIDLTLIGNSHIRQILNDLDELLLPYMIDVSIQHHIDNKELLEHIDRVGKVFYNKTNHTHSHSSLG